MGVVGCRRDLCECRRLSAGFVLVSRQGRVDGGRKRGGELLVWVSWAGGGTCVGFAGHRRDLSWCRSWDASMMGGEGMVGVWRLQPGDLEIFILLYRTPKRRHFYVVFFFKKN